MTFESQTESLPSCWNTTFEQSEIGIALLSVDGRILSANPGFCRWCGRHRDGLQRLRIWDLVHADDQERCRHLFAEVVIELKALAQLEVRLGNEGEPPVLLQLLHGGQTAAGERQLIAQIIPDSGLLELTRHSSRPSLLQTVLASIDAHIHVKDAQGRYVFVNEGSHINSTSPFGRDIIGMKDDQIMPPRWADPIVAFDREVFEQGGPLCQEERIPFPDGSERVFLSRKLLYPTHGKAEFLIGCSTDITALKQATAQLAASEEQFRLLAENSGDVVFLLNTDGSVRWVSPSLTTALGWLPQDWVGQPGTRFLVHQGQHPQYQDNLRRLVEDQLPTLARDEIYAKDGTVHWIETHCTPFITTNGRIDGFVGHFRLIDDLISAMTHLKQSEERHRRLADHILDVVWSLSLEGHFSYVSPSVERIRGFSPAEVMAMPLAQNYTPESYLIFCQALEQARRDLQAGRSVNFEAELQEICKDGSTIWSEVRATGLTDGDGNIRELIGISRNITEQHRLREQLRTSEERYRLLADNARDVIWTTEVDGRCSFCSPSVFGLRGFTPEEVIGQAWEQALTPDSVAICRAYFHALQADIAAGRELQRFRGEVEFTCKDGSTVWAEAIAVPMLDDQGRFVRLLGTCRDISERKQYEQELELANEHLQSLASIDALTEVWNRRHLETLILQAISRSDRHGEPLTLILCDVDQFKAINDGYGHLIGDLVLVEFCRRIRGSLRKGDCLGRWGGEEFVLLLPHCPQQAGLALAEKLRAAIEATPFELAGTITASFGVAQRLRAEPQLAWLQRVDQALYAAKAAGRNRVMAAPAPSDQG